MQWPYCGSHQGVEDVATSFSAMRVSWCPKSVIREYPHRTPAEE